MIFGVNSSGTTNPFVATSVLSYLWYRREREQSMFPLEVIFTPVFIEDCFAWAKLVPAEQSHRASLQCNKGGPTHSDVMIVKHLFFSQGSLSHKALLSEIWLVLTRECPWKSPLYIKSTGGQILLQFTAYCVQTERMRHASFGVTSIGHLLGKLSRQSTHIGDMSCWIRGMFLEITFIHPVF